MNILVCVKRIPLVGSQIVLTGDSMAVDTSKLGFQLSPHEENAVEAGVRLVEEHGGQVVLLTVGDPGSEEQLRELLAVGADRAIVVDTAGASLDPQATAKAIADAAAADGTAWDLVIMGTESGDDQNYQTGIRVAHRLGLPVVTNVKGLQVAGGTATCERAVGSGREVYTVPLPAVLTVVDGLNTPRYPSVPGRIKARKKPVDVVQITIDAPRLRTQSLSVAPSQSKGATDLGTGADAAAKLVDIFRQIGVLS